MTKILLCGCLGKMGTAVSKLAERNPNTEITAGIDVVKGEAKYPIFTNINDCNLPVDAIICVADSDILSIIEYGAARKISLAICTTALPPEAEAEIASAAEKVAVLRSANMSLGINLLSSMLKRVSKLLFDAGFDIEITEKHHNQKTDAPSGTAYLLAASVNEALGGKMRLVTDRSQVREKRTRNEIGMHALRGGTIVGEHSVTFAGHDEVIELTHIAGSRELFAAGALKAAEFLKGKPAKMYEMCDLVECF